MYSNAAGVLTQHFEAYGVSPSKNRWVGNVPKFASLNEACKAAVTAEIENVDSTTKLEKPIKLTTSGRGKLTTLFAGEDFKFMHLG